MSQAEAEAVKLLFATHLSRTEAEIVATTNCGDGWLPLHRAMWIAKGRYSVEVLKSIFDAYPSAAKAKTNDGWLPLHIVASCIGGAEGLRAMQGLLSEYPHAAKEKDNEGWLPIHLICHNETGATLEMVRLLLFVYPEAAEEKGNDGCLPLHFVAGCMGGADGLCAMRLLLAECPQAAKVRNNKGNLPIHLVCQNESGTLEMVRTLLSAYPEAINEKNGDGRTPYAESSKFIVSPIYSPRLPWDASELLREAEQGERHRHYHCLCTHSHNLSTPRLCSLIDHSLILFTSIAATCFFVSLQMLF